VKFGRSALALVFLVVFAALGALGLIASLLLHGVAPDLASSNTARNVLPAIARSTPACSTTWTGASSDEWTTGSNWSTRTVPTSTAWVCIPARVRNLPVLVSDDASVDGVTNSGGIEVLGALNLTSRSVASTSTGSLRSYGGLSIAHALTVSGSFATVGGTISGLGTATVVKGATWTASGTGVALKVLNEGLTIVATGGSLVIATGGTFDNLESLTLDSNASILGSCSGHATTGGTLVNAGTLDLVPGTGNLAYLGDVEQAEACLVVQNEKSLLLSSGAAVIEQNAVLDLDAGSVVSGSAPLEVGALTGTYRSGTLSVNTPISVPALVVADGEVKGSGALTVAASLTMSGGTLAGPGPVTVAKDATWKASGGVVATDLTNLGSATIPASGSVTVETPSRITNEADLTVGSAAGIYGLCPGSATSGGEVVNSGTLSFSPGTGGTAYIGDLEGAEHCLSVIDEKDLAVTSGTATLYEDASVTLESGSSETGSGALDVGDGAATHGAGSLDVASASTVTSIEVAKSGAVSGSGALSVAAALDTAGGILAGPGSITLQPKATWTTSAAVIETSIVNEGTATVATGGSVTLDTGATLNNSGKITLDSGASLLGSCIGTEQTGGTVTNTGTVTFAPGLGGQSFLGDVEAAESCLDVRNEHSLVLSSGTAVVYEDASLDLDDGSAVSGTGNLEIGDSAVAYPAGTLEVDVNSTISSLTVGPDGTVDGSGDLTISSELSTVSDKNASGALAGPGSVTVGSEATWSAGGGLVATTVLNDGTASLQAGAVETVVPGPDVANASVTNATGASLTLGDGSQLDLSTGASLDNSGTTTLENGASILGSCTGDLTSGGEVDNSGTLAFSTGTGNSAGLGDTGESPCLEVEDTGQITVTSVDSSALVFEYASLDLESGASVTGLGTLTIGGFEPGTLNVDADASVTNLAVAAGTAQGSGQLTVTSSLTTGTGAVLAGPGGIAILIGASWIADAGTIETTVTNNGTATVPTNSSLTLTSGALLTNGGTLTVEPDAAVLGSCTDSTESIGVLNNTMGGTLTFAPASGEPTFLGEIATETEDPCLDIEDAGGLDMSTEGQVVLEEQATMTLESGATVTGQGTLVITSPTGSALAGGTLAVSDGASVSMPSLTVQTGVVQIGSGADLTVSNSFTTEANGTISGPADDMGALTVEGTWTVYGGILANLVDVTNAGSATVPGTAPLTIQTGATLSNQGTLTFDAQGAIDGDCPGNAVQPGIVANTGTVDFNPGIGNSVLLGDPSEPDQSCLDVQNGGSFELESGTVEDYQSASLDFDSGSQVTGSGLLEVYGSGTLNLNANVTVPTLSMVDGTINIASGVTASVGTLEGSPSAPDGGEPAGYLDVDLSGTTSPGQLDVTGAAAVDPGDLALVIVPVESFAPTCDQQVMALTAQSWTGNIPEFEGVSGMTPAGDEWVLANGATWVGAGLSCS
jgi:hypothetical protein